jgi:hypothetical protein
MSLGPGRYNEVATYVRKRVNAKGVVLIIMEGDKGEGFEVQAPLPIVLGLPKLLREVADQIEASGPLAP